MHEIGHTLGFTSGVDYLDENPGSPDNVYAYVSTLDLYRFSNNSMTAGADIDWTADTRSKYFSFDGGNTILAYFSTGVNYGDGYETGHWKNGSNAGIMDPTTGSGKLLEVTNLDKLALDVIGWDLKIDPLSVQSVPYSQNFSTGLPDASQGWEYYSDSEGRIDVVYGRLRMDDYGENYIYSLNEAILHVDLTGRSNVSLMLDQRNLADESTALPTQFEGHYKGDGISLSVDGIHWVTITSLTGNFTNKEFLLDSIIEQAKIAAGSDNISDVRVKFQQYDNSTAWNDGREFDNIKVTYSSSVTVQSVPYSQGFSSGLPDASLGWEYYSDSEGRIDVVYGRLRMDDYGENYIYSLNEAILHVDLTGRSNVSLMLDQRNLADESTALPTQFEGHYKGDGISLSVDGIHWVTITSLTGNFTNKEFLLDSIIEQAKIAAGSDNISDVRVKFQQYDNSTAWNDGREFDNIKVTYSSSVTVQSVPYSQGFSSGLPDASLGWEYYSDSEGRIDVVYGRLRMDDYGENYIYSLNEAILHVDLTGRSNVSLMLDQRNLADESTALPTQFEGHYKGDGISLSVDGIHWVTITSLTGNFTNQEFMLDSIIEQAKIAAGSDDISDVRVKFQQYDNSTAWNDGREFDNIKIS